MTTIMEKLEEYAQKGVLNIWVIDPRLRTMSVKQEADPSWYRG